MKNKRGFTLIELVVVMALIAVLAVLMIGGINAARQNSRNTKYRDYAKSMQLALESYYSNNGSYPANVNVTEQGYSVAEGYLSNYFGTTMDRHPDHKVCYRKTSASTYLLWVQPEEISGVCSHLVYATPTNPSYRTINDFSVRN